MLSKRSVDGNNPTDDGEKNHRNAKPLTFTIPNNRLGSGDSGTGGEISTDYGPRPRRPWWRSHCGWPKIIPRFGRIIRHFLKFSYSSVAANTYLSYWSVSVNQAGIIFEKNTGLANEFQVYFRLRNEIQSINQKRWHP
jgi:hypothetical protein